MTILFSILSLCLLLLQSAWIETVNPDGRFSISAPGIFSEKTDTVATGIGALVYHTFFIQTPEKEDENLFYMVSYCDYPEGAIGTDSIALTEEILQTTLEAATETVKGTLRYATDVKIAGQPGKFWRIDYLDGKAVIKTHAFFAGSRYYSLQTIAYAQSGNASASRFFDSFRLL